MGCPWSFFGRSLDDVDRREQADPDHVDEVPVVGRDDRAGRLLRREAADRRAHQHDDEGEQPADHVQAVEAGREVEDRAVAALAMVEALVHELAVLVGLADDEDRAHDQREDVPAAQAVDVTALGGEHAELAGHRRRHEDRS